MKPGNIRRSRLRTRLRNTDAMGGRERRHQSGITLSGGRSGRTDDRVRLRTAEPTRGQGARAAVEAQSRGTGPRHRSGGPLTRPSSSPHVPARDPLVWTIGTQGVTEQSTWHPSVGSNPRSHFHVRRAYSTANGENICSLTRASTQGATWVYSKSSSTLKDHSEQISRTSSTKS